jgi:hypothetical protein
MDLDSPVVRIAAATGEDPDDVQAALAALRADGMSEDDLWGFVRTIRPGDSCVARAADLLRER